MTVTTAIVLDKRRMIKRTKNYPVCIRVTFQRVPRNFPIGLQLSAKDFGKLSSPNLGDKLRQIKEKLDKEQGRAQAIIKNFNKFSFGAFREQFSSFRPGSRKRSGSPPAQVTLPPATATRGICDLNVKESLRYLVGVSGNRSFKRNQFGGRKYPHLKSEMDFQALGEVAYYYGQYIVKLEAQERIGTVSAYMNSLASLLDFRPGLQFADMTEMKLYEYEKWMKKRGRSITTVGMYLRCYRHILNKAIKKRIVSKDDYPFGQDAYVIPRGRNIKKALSAGDLRRLWEYRSEDPEELMYRDCWFFLYSGNGMNAKDMALLKYSMIDGRFIRFQRAKTILTSRDNPIVISVFISDFVQALIDRWGNKDRCPDNYIFPILSPCLDVYMIRNRVQLFIKAVNSAMYGIAGKLGIVRKVSTTAARHSLATLLKRSKVDFQEIQELIGHASLATTMYYFDGFEDESKESLAGKFLPFLGKEQNKQLPATALDYK
jgi:integrase/recombinase XerD